ncbi:MAG: metal-dependent transcriptional regulator [Haloferacaceae archaeon]
MTEAARYLIVLYAAEGEGSGPVPPGDVADALDRSPSTATEMLQRLEERGLVTHEPYQGATLTAEGRDAAADLYRTYRTLSRFFREVLDLDDHEEEAMRLAGNVSPTVADRLAATLLDDADPDEPVASLPGPDRP